MYRMIEISKNEKSPHSSTGRAQKIVQIVVAFERRTSRNANIIATISYTAIVVIRHFALLPPAYVPLPFFLYFFLGLFALGSVKQMDAQALAELDRILISRGMRTYSLLAHIMVYYLPGVAGLLVAVTYNQAPLAWTIALFVCSVTLPQVYYQYRKRLLQKS